MVVGALPMLRGACPADAAQCSPSLSIVGRQWRGVTGSCLGTLSCRRPLRSGDGRSHVECFLRLSASHDRDYRGLEGGIPG